MLASPTRDLATGKTKVYYFLDPKKIAEKSVSFDADWQDTNLFVPGVLVEGDEAKCKLRLSSGDIVTVPTEGLVKLSEQDHRGVPDILHLDNFSQQSLIHTIRLRFKRVAAWNCLASVLVWCFCARFFCVCSNP